MEPICSVRLLHPGRVSFGPLDGSRPFPYRCRVNSDPKSDLDRELLLFEQKLPRFFSRVVDWVRRPTSRLIRLPVAFFLILFGMFGFLPVVGFWMVPLGLLLIARDVPALEPPLAKLLGWVNRNWPGSKARKTDQPPR